MRIELQFMPKARKWRVLVGGKALPRRYSDRASALKEFKKQQAKYNKPEHLFRPVDFSGNISICTGTIGLCLPWRLHRNRWTGNCI